MKPVSSVCMGVVAAGLMFVIAVMADSTGVAFVAVGLGGAFLGIFAVQSFLPDPNEDYLTERSVERLRRDNPGDSS